MSNSTYIAAQAVQIYVDPNISSQPVLCSYTGSSTELPEPPLGPNQLTLNIEHLEECKEYLHAQGLIEGTDFRLQIHNYRTVLVLFESEEHHALCKLWAPVFQSKIVDAAAFYCPYVPLTISSTINPTTMPVVLETRYAICDEAVKKNDQ